MPHIIGRIHTITLLIKFDTHNKRVLIWTGTIDFGSWIHFATNPSATTRFASSPESSRVKLGLM